MIHTVVGQKIQQSQRFLTDGTRIPVTVVRAQGNTVLTHKMQETHGYWAVQIGFGTKKKATKAELGQIKGANMKVAPRYLREVRFGKHGEEVTQDELPKVGDVIKVSDVFKPGDIVDVIGISKGKGYAGVVKRYHFRGGPRTHGQSDRERAPGSIGQTTTPGRVYKGKKMAGRMGQERVTVKNLQVVAVTDEEVMINGLVPGAKQYLVMVKKVGEGKTFVPLYEDVTQVEKEPEIVEAGKGEEVHEPVQEETPVVEDAKTEGEEKKEEVTPAEEVKEKNDAKSE